MNTEWKLVNALRDSLLWTASSLAAIGKEQDVITLEGRKRTVGEILDEANEALNVPDDAAPTSHPIPTGATGDRDWELPCDECNASGHVFVKHQVAERKTDVQEFKEECEACEGRGFNIAFEDIPGIAEYVKSCQPAATATTEGGRDERQGFETWAKKKKMPLARIGQQYDDFWVDHAWNGWQARASFSAPAAGDALGERHEWMACDMRHRIATDNLKLSAAEMRAREKRCRNAYTLEYMGAPMRWLADAYAEAAAVFEAKLAAIAQQKGEA